MSFVLLDPPSDDAERAAVATAERARNALDGNAALIAVGETDFGALWRFADAEPMPRLHRSPRMQAGGSAVLITLSQVVVLGAALLLSIPTGAGREPDRRSPVRPATHRPAARGAAEQLAGPERLGPEPETGRRRRAPAGAGPRAASPSPTPRTSRRRRRRGRPRRWRGAAEAPDAVAMADARGRRRACAVRRSPRLRPIPTPIGENPTEPRAKATTDGHDALDLAGAPRRRRAGSRCVAAAAHRRRRCRRQPSSCGPASRRGPSVVVQPAESRQLRVCPGPLLVLAEDAAAGDGRELVRLGRPRDRRRSRRRPRRAGGARGARQPPMPTPTARRSRSPRRPAR